MLGHRKGFTLVELSIVLVIIGLLIGGVLKGQAMIENAKIKNFVSDVDGLVAATYGYQDKFNALPGDGTNANDNGASTAGDGNGQIDTANEQLGFYQNVISEGFITGDAAATTLATIAKETPFGSYYEVISLTGGGAPHAGAANAVRTADDIVPEDVAQSLDTKYDDGVYNTGDLQSDSAYTTGATKQVTWYKF